VDLDAGVVKLDPNTVTKNNEGRTLPTRALPEIHDLLVAQRAFVTQTNASVASCAAWYSRG
jgi:hypothetical protein